MQVSIIIPCYNVSLFVEEGINSILKQSYADLEIVCLDDHSTDGTFEILLNLSKIDSRIKLYRNDINLGLVNTLNKLVVLATNEVLIRMDPDDVALENRIFSLVEKYIETNSDIVSSDYSLIDERGYRIKQRSLALMVTKLGIRYTTFFNSPIPHSPSLIKRYVLVNNPYDNSFKAAEDYNLWSNLLLNENFKVTILKEKLYLYRMNPAGESHSNQILQAENHIRIAKNFIKKNLKIESEQMDFWCISKNNYNFDNVNKEVLRKTLKDIEIIRQTFLNANILTRQEKNEINTYTSQYLIYSYMKIFKNCIDNSRLSLAFSSVLVSLISNFKIILNFKNLKWIIKNI